MITIAYVCDEKYKPYLLKSMESVRRYNKDVAFAILSRTITQEDMPYPDVRCYLIDPGKAQFKFKPNDRMGEGVYYKFYLPYLPYDKVLYIDTDVVCQRPLDPLWNENCPYICATESHSFGKKQAAELGLQKYALTGMMLMNLKALREIDFTNRCLERISRENPNQHDETIINLEFNDKIRFVDRKYNYCRNRKYDNPIPESDAYLLHYVGAQQKVDMLKTDNFSRLGPLKILLQGKSVAIVGNSQGILTKVQGNEIDSHDIVIRFNKGYPSKEVGKKTTILFLACTLTPEEMNRFGARYTVKRSNLSQNTCTFKVSATDRAALAQSATEIVAEQINRNKCQPSTGFLAINFALSCNCKSIDIYGFDFFKGNTYYNPEGYKTLHNGPKEAEKVLEYQKYGLLEIK